MRFKVRQGFTLFRSIDDLVEGSADRSIPRLNGGQSSELREDTLRNISSRGQLGMLEPLDQEAREYYGDTRPARPKLEVRSTSASVGESRSTVMDFKSPEAGAAWWLAHRSQELANQRYLFRMLPERRRWLFRVLPGSEVQLDPTSRTDGNPRIYRGGQLIELTDSEFEIHARHVEPADDQTIQHVARRANAVQG